MPFKSEAQRRWMWATHPKMAQEWANHSKKKPKPKPTELLFEADADGRIHANMSVAEIIAAKQRRRKARANG